MINQFKKTPFSGIIDYNDPSIEQWAENIYEKIRQTGELAGYVERDKVIRERFNVIDGTSGAIVADAPPVNTRIILTDDNRFVWGNAYSGDLLTIVDNRIENLGRQYQVEFEILFNEVAFVTVNLFDAFVSIESTGILSVGSAVFSGLTFATGTLYHVKIIRENWIVSLFIDGLFIGKESLDSDSDTQFQVLYGSLNTPPDLHPDFNLDYNRDFYSLNL